MELRKEIRGALAIGAVFAVSLGGCALSEGKSPQDKPGLVSCVKLDALIHKSGTTVKDVLKLAGQYTDLSCREPNGEIRENGGGIG